MRAGTDALRAQSLANVMGICTSPSSAHSLLPAALAAKNAPSGAWLVTGGGSAAGAAPAARAGPGQVRAAAGGVRACR